MQKTSKVTKAFYTNRTWQSKRGDTYHVHMIELENGDKGEYSSRTEEQNKFIVGQETEYEIESNGKYGNKIKPINKGGGGGYRGGGYKADPETERMRSRCMIASYVKDMIVASGFDTETRHFNIAPEAINAYFDALAKKVFNGETKQNNR